MKQKIKRFMALLLCVMLMVGNASFHAFAEENPQENSLVEKQEDVQKEPRQGEEANGTVEPETGETVPDKKPASDGEPILDEKPDKEETSGDSLNETEEAGSEASEKLVSFSEEAEVDGVIVKVEAEPGTFPEGAKLIVKKVNKAEETMATEAIDEVRSGNVNVAESYTFDIKVVDAEGNEIQPAEGKTVNVSFGLRRAADSNLTADVYHITETGTDVEARKLETETDAEEAVVTAETDGFSLYTVEFTYSNLQYVMEGGTSIRLAEILAHVGLEGEVENVTVSNEELFSASKESGEWIITSHKDFSSEEWMKVVIGGVEYTIVVSDDSDVVYVDTWQGLMDAVKNSENKNKTIALTDHIRAEGKDRILIKQDLTIDLKGFTVDRGRTKNDTDGHVFEIQNKSTVKITDSSAIPSGTITGGYASRGGGIHVGSNCTCIVENITIRQNKAGADGGGVYVRGTLIMNNCTVSDNEAEETAGGIYCQDTGTIMLDNVEVTGNKAEGDGGGFKIHLKNSDSYIKDSRIYGNSSGEEGGGICLDGDSNTLTLNDTEIFENYAEDEGGAIEIDSGTMKMNGGLIKGNKSADGGGVYNDSGKIDFDGVEISGNESISEGGAGINNKNDAMLKNCLIKENIGHDRGGGIWASDDITLESCTIEGNTSTGEGGGMYFKDIDATVRDCTIINNKTNASGGGIRIEDGKIFVINVTMTGNYAKENGGAVYTNNDAGVYFSGITNITENEAGKQGGGFMVGMHTSTAGIQDTVIIRDNTCGELGPNVHLGYINETSLIDSVGDFFDDFSVVETEYDYAQLKLTEKLSPDTCIYVTTQANFKNYSEDITVNYSKYHDGEDPTEYFITEPNYTVVRLSGEEELRLSTSMWPELQRLIDKTENKGTIELDRNWKAIKNNEALVIPEGKTITIDLAGYTIDRNCLNSDPDSAGYVFDVQGTLIVKDSSTGQTGKITGGNGKNGGGIYVRNTGSFTLKSGNIVSNEAACGGAVYNEGKVQISGGNIKGNSVSNAGGAIYNAENASLTISGGELSGNDAKKAAGGVYLAEGSTFNVEGNAYVNGNSGSSGNNIFIVDANNVIHVTGALSSKASLDFSVNITDPSQERKVTDGLNNTAAAAFSYNGKQYDTTESSVLKLGDDEELYIKGSNAPYDLLVSDWQQLYNALRNSENAGKIIGLANNLKAEGDDEELESTISNITLDLRGFTLDRNGKKGSVLNVVTNGVTFTVIDSVGSGLLTGGNANHGGGVYVKKGIFVMNGGTIANNKVNDDGAGVYCKE